MPSLPDSILNDDNEQIPYKFAYPFDVSISCSEQIPVTSQDTIFYKLNIISDGAYSLNLIFEDLYIPKGAVLKIYGTNNIDYCAYTSDYNVLSGILATPLIHGDTLFVDYLEPKNVAGTGKWKITQVAHDYKNFIKEKTLLKSSSSSCNVDINCEDGNDWQTEKRAVCRIIFQGTTACTGALINNTASDNTPYVLTANHCVSSSTTALKTVFYFDYENENCGDGESTKIAKTLSGATLVATSPSGKIDFSLLKISEAPPKSYNPYYAGWSISENLNSGAACIHHPKGDVKKISIENGKPQSATFSNSYVTKSHWRIANWEVGTTENGSSGSPLFNSEHKIIGDLSGGEADCNNPVNDYFSKISTAWDYYTSSSNQLKTWLDPVNLGITSCEGFDPYSLSEDLLTNIWFDDTSHLFDFADDASGYWTSVNEIGWRTFAERLITTKYIYDFNIGGVIDTTENLNDVRFVIWGGTDVPETELYSVKMSKELIIDSAWIHIPLSTPLKIEGKCWIGYQSQNNSSAFSAYLVSDETGEGTFFVKHPKSWVNTKNIGFTAHMDVIAHVTEQPDTISKSEYKSTFLNYLLSDDIIHKTTKELFGIDSLGSDNVKLQYNTLANSTLSNMSGPNEIGFNCLANKYNLNTPIFIRSLKLAIAEIPDESLHTKVILWNDDMTEEISQKIVSNADLKKDYYNQIHFDSLIYVDTTFAYGICFDTANYEGNITLYQSYDIESLIDGYFHFDKIWSAFADYGVSYNNCIQPITAITTYHYNPDSAKILYYPLLNNKKDVTMSSKNTFIVYPTICSDYITIRFVEQFYNSIKVKIVDSQGRLLSSSVYNMENGIFTVPVSNLSSGVFIIEIEAEDYKASTKILHQRN